MELQILTKKFNAYWMQLQFFMLFIQNFLLRKLSQYLKAYFHKWLGLTTL